ncbi:MAG: hypothetical protein R3Y28_05510 [Candidatus Gastranaerophilales bacterium]
MQINSVNNFHNNYAKNYKNNFNGQQSDKSTDKKVKAGVKTTTALATGITLGLIAKKQGFSLSPKKIFKTPMKDWAIFKLPNKNKPNDKTLQFEAKEILSLASSSVAGGLAGGIIFDKKENRKAKIKEGLNQIVGDVAVPLMFVAGPAKAYETFTNKAFDPNAKESVRNLAQKFKTNKFLKIAAPVVVGAVSLGAGIIAGNKTANFINEKIYKEKRERQVKATDFAPHIDDVCLAATLMAEKSTFSGVVSKLVPFALLVPGFETGLAQK